LPFNVVSSGGFLNLMHVLEPLFTVADRTTYSSTYLGNLWSSAKSDIQQKLSKMVACCATSDGWSGDPRMHFCSFTLHWISADWKLHNTILTTTALPVRQDSVAIAEAWKETMTEFGVKPSRMTADGAAVMPKACNVGGISYMPCLAHVLQLVVRYGFDVPGISLVLTQCKKVVSFFSRSCQATQLLLSVQKAKGITKPKRLILECATRWNSVHDMAGRLILLKDHIADVVKDKKISRRDLLLPDDYFEVLKEVCAALERFSSITKYLQGSGIISPWTLFELERLLQQFHLTREDLDNEQVSMSFTGRSTSGSAEDAGRSLQTVEELADSIESMLLPVEMIRTADGISPACLSSDQADEGSSSDPQSGSCKNASPPPVIDAEEVVDEFKVTLSAELLGRLKWYLSLPNVLSDLQIPQFLCPAIPRALISEDDKLGALAALKERYELFLKQSPAAAAKAVDGSPEELAEGPGDSSVSAPAPKRHKGLNEQQTTSVSAEESDVLSRLNLAMEVAEKAEATKRGRKPNPKTAVARQLEIFGNSVFEVPDAIATLLKTTPGNPQKTLDEAILEFWSKASHTLPFLAKQAALVFSLEVTSASSERLYSRAGSVVSAKRSSLSEENVDKLLFLQRPVREQMLTQLADRPEYDARLKSYYCL
jgi:hypothetical protein